LDSYSNSSERLKYSAGDLQSYLHPNQLEGWRHASKQALSAGRAFFGSTTRFMGLIPRRAIPGDLIYIIVSANVSYTLQRREDSVSFALIREYDALELMHREAMKDFPSLQREETLVVNQSSRY
jgi:hypothetical protein